MGKLPILRSILYNTFTHTTLFQCKKMSRFKGSPLCPFLHYEVHYAKLILTRSSWSGLYFVFENISLLACSTWSGSYFVFAYISPAHKYFVSVDTYFERGLVTVNYTFLCLFVCWFVCCRAN